MTLSSNNLKSSDLLFETEDTRLYIEEQKMLLRKEGNKKKLGLGKNMPRVSAIKVYRVTSNGPGGEIIAELC